MMEKGVVCQIDFWKINRLFCSERTIQFLSNRFFKSSDVLFEKHDTFNLSLFKWSFITREKSLYNLLKCRFSSLAISQGLLFYSCNFSNVSTLAFPSRLAKIRSSLPPHLKNERLLPNDKTLGFLAFGGDKFNPGPETRLDHSELLCNKVLLKYKGDRESF